MANPTPSNLFQKGNQIGKLGKGVPKPTLRKDWKRFENYILEDYTEEEILGMIRRQPEIQQLYFIEALFKQDRDHYEKMLRIELDNKKLTPLDPSENNIIIIKGPENEEELDGM